jgi:ABC-type arginine transport system ATPase subunit
MISLSTHYNEREYQFSREEAEKKKVPYIQLKQKVGISFCAMVLYPHLTPRKKKTKMGDLKFNWTQKVLCMLLRKF